MQDNNYKELEYKGLFGKFNQESGITVYRHTHEYINNLLDRYNFSQIKKTEYTAFVDPLTGKKTYFKIMVTQKVK